MTNKSQNYMLQEATLERVPEEGITHTTDPSARLWPVEVHFSTGLRPSRETVRATSADQALEFVAARYRFADMGRTRVLVDVPAQEAPPIVQAVNAVEVRSLADLLLDELPADGGTISDGEARDALSAALDRFVPDSQFQQVKRHLVESGLAKRCRGRGGPLARVMEPSITTPVERPNPAPKVVKAPPAPLDPPAQTVEAPLDNDGSSAQTMEAPLDPPPTPLDPPVVQVVPGEKDSQGRTLVSDQNARAAAILHVSGQATWEELARTIGCNRDHLRRKASSFKPQLKAADLVPAAAAAPIDGTMIGFMPAIGWAVVISSSADAMTAAGFTDVSPLQTFGSTR